MKHTHKVTALLLTLFILTQFIGIFVAYKYSPETFSFTDDNGNTINKTTYNLPYGLEPPEKAGPASTAISIIVAIILAAFLMLVLMKYKAEILLRLWFFVVVSLAIAVTLNSFFLNIPYAAYVSFGLAIILAFFKIFKRQIIVHNLTELFIYPGIAVLIIPLLSIGSIVLLLILISIYDMYAVWHAGFMQKMAKYQMQKLKVFTGFFIPYVRKQDKELMQQQKVSKLSEKGKSTKQKRVKVSVAILGGGDVVFPIITAGVALHTLGFLAAFLVVFGAAAALLGLFYLSEKGKFYPAMPFITAGCFIALAIAYLIY